jgi:hypothetical protein
LIPGDPPMEPACLGAAGCTPGRRPPGMPPAHVRASRGAERSEVRWRSYCGTRPVAHDPDSAAACRCLVRRCGPDRAMIASSDVVTSSACDGRA